MAINEVFCIAKWRSIFKEKLFAEGLASIFIRFIYLPLQFVVSIFLARMLGPKDFGVYTLAMAVVSLLAMLSQLGFPGYLVRMVSLYVVTQEIGKLNGLIRHANIVAVSLSAISALILCVAFFEFNFLHNKFHDELILYIITLFPLLVFMILNGSILRGLGYVIIAQIPEQVIRSCIFLLILLILGELGRISIESSLIANCISTLVALVMGALILNRKRLAMPLADHQYANILWFRGALPFFLLSGVQVVGYQADIFMLGMMTTDEDIGLYRVAVQVADGLGAFLIAITIVITPRVARLHTLGDFSGLQRLLVVSHRIAVLFLLPVVLMIIFNSEWVIGFVFGAEYIRASEVTVILVIGKLLYATVCYSAVALSMLGAANIAAWFTGGAMLIGLTLNYVWIPLYGIKGVAMASSISAFILSVACAIWMYTKYRMDISFLGIQFGPSQGVDSLESK